MKRSDNAGKTVKIIPIETDREYKDVSGEKRLMQRQWQPDKFGRFFPANLTPEQIKPVLFKARVKIENLRLEKEADFIVYQYKGRPLLKLNLKDGSFYAPSSEIEEHTKEAVQQQAHMLLENLKKAGLSGAVIGKPIFPSSARQVLGHLKTYKK
jgi:hypothetical protein